MVRFRLHFSRRGFVLAVVLWLLASAAGCAMFDRESWDFNRYRDARAVDIDRRLEQSAPPVENPF